MLKVVQQMVEIQELDKELIELNSQLAQYPGIWEQTKSRLSAAKNRADSAKAAAEANLLNRRRIEKALREQAELLRRYQMQSNLVKSQKELTALSTQIEGIRARISSLEKEGLGELEREPAVAAEVEDSAKEFAAIEKEAKAERSRIKAQIAEKRAAIAGFEKRREKVFVGLPDREKVLYERTNRRHPGSAVVVVRPTGQAQEKSCSGCNFKVLAHTLSALHHGEKIQLCDNCGRVLSHDESYQPQESEVG